MLVFLPSARRVDVDAAHEPPHAARPAFADKRHGGRDHGLLSRRSPRRSASTNARRAAHHERAANAGCGVASCEEAVGRFGADRQAGPGTPARKAWSEVRATGEPLDLLAPWKRCQAGKTPAPRRAGLPGSTGRSTRRTAEPSPAESRSGPVFHGPPRAWRVPPSHGGCASQPSWLRPARQRDAASRRHRVPSRPTQAAQQFVQRQPPPGTRQFGSHFQNAGSRAPVRGFVRRCLNPSRLPTYDSTAFFAAWSPRPFCDSGSLTASGVWPTSASALTESDESTSVAAER